MADFIPSVQTIAIFFLAATVPAFLLMRYIYRRDSVEKEPINLIIKLMLLGVAAAVVSIGLETFGTGLLDAFINGTSQAYTLLMAFVVVAVAEEGTKLFFLWLGCWKNSNFNYRFDGIVYSAAVSLGFAAIENVLYVFNYGMSVAVARAFLSVPAHLGFSVFMGVFYGRAKLYSGDRPRRRRNLFAGYLSAVLLHGFYDACAMMQTELATAMFIAFVVMMYIIVIIIIRQESRSDSRL